MESTDKRHDLARCGGGFTLIELIVVIVILGILAATALPKFIDLSGNARAAVIRSLEGAARSANTMLHASILSKGQGIESYSNYAVTWLSSIAGWSIGSSYGFAEEVQGLSALMNLPADIDVNFSANTFSHRGAKDPDQCKMTYTPATATTPPAYSITTDGC